MSGDKNREGSIGLTALWFGGMVAIFIGERLISAGTWRWLGAAGAAMVVAAILLRWLRGSRFTDEARCVERWLVYLYKLGAIAVVMYAAQSDLVQLDKSWPKLTGALGALWPAVWLAAAAPIVLVEAAYASVARAPHLELARIRDALYSGLGLAGALVFAFTFAYVSSERDKKVDLSYFRTARPGEATKKLAASLDQPVEVDLFFPSANEVKDQVELYFDDLKKESKLLDVHRYDNAIDPAKAKELGVTGNGTVAIKRAGRKELLTIGLELEAARSQLLNLDKEVNKRLLQVAKPQRTVYLVTGHGERSDAPSSDTDQRLTIRELRELLQSQGFLVRNLSAADGLAADVPSDAALLLVIGPQKPFIPEELAALERYLDKGGRLFLALDPENGPMTELTSILGLKYFAVTLADDQDYARRSSTVADRANIVVQSFSSHPSVTTLSHHGAVKPMILVGAGPLEEIPVKERPDSRKNLSIDFTVRSHLATWNDIDGNFELNPPKERRQVWHLGAAVVRKRPGNKPADETRALVLGDSDAVADKVVNLYGNPHYVVDGVKWLLGDEALAGEVSSEVDVPVAHTRKQDVIWFYSTIFLAPLAALGLGTVVTRRRRGRKEKA
jgi:ABC-type uncharacterized transport system